MHARPSNKDTGRLLQQVEAQGWVVTGGGSHHYKLRCPRPCRCYVVMASSTANRQVIRRMLTRLRQSTCWKEPKK